MSQQQIVDRALRVSDDSALYGLVSYAGDSIGRFSSFNEFSVFYKKATSQMTSEHYIQKMESLMHKVKKREEQWQAYGDRYDSDEDERLRIGNETYDYEDM